MADRSSRPHRSPTKTPPEVVRADRAAAVAAPARPGPDRRPARHAGLHRARRAGALPDQPALPHRPRHRRAAAPLRARPPRLADPRRRHQVRQHPRRRRLALRRPSSKATSNRAGHRADAPANAATPTGPRSAPRSCTPSSTTTPASPTPRSAPTRRPPPRSASCSAPWPGSPTAASPSSGCCPTTAPAYRSYAWRDACAAARDHPQTDPALPAPDQRQDRTLPPHPGRRLGLRPVLRLRNRTPRRPARLAALLQSPPRPLRHRRPATHHPTDQPPWTSQLAAKDSPWDGIWDEDCSDAVRAAGHSKFADSRAPLSRPPATPAGQPRAAPPSRRSPAAGRSRNLAGIEQALQESKGAVRVQVDAQPGARRAAPVSGGGQPNLVEP